MKIVAKYLCAIILPVLCLCDAGAATQQKNCPPGCFCVFGGKIPTTIQTVNICGYAVAHQINCRPYLSYVFGRGNSRGTLVCSRDDQTQATYYFDEFSEVFEANTGLYGYKGDNLVAMPSWDVALNDFGEAGVYPCPSVFPNSAPGAKSLAECFKYDKNGNKVYYHKRTSHHQRVNNVNKIKTVVSGLQSDLNSVNVKMQSLQNLVNN